MQVAVDADACQGHARCWSLCPDVFGLDDEGHAVVQVEVVPARLEDKVRDAVGNCPERAISIAP